MLEGDQINQMLMEMELVAGSFGMESTTNLTKLSLGRDRRDLSNAIDVGRGREAGRLSVTSRGATTVGGKGEKGGCTQSQAYRAVIYRDGDGDASEPRPEQREMQGLAASSRGDGGAKD